jgi:hypothetical protein
MPFLSACYSPLSDLYPSLKPVANDSTYSVRGLDGGAVGDGVGKGHAELNDIYESQLSILEQLSYEIACCTYQHHQPPWPA